MVVMQKNNIKVILFLFVLLGFCSCFMVNHSKREKMSKQAFFYALYLENLPV